jgi:hypothetical protein
MEEAMVLGGKGRPSLRVNSVLFGNDPERISRTVMHLERACDLAIAAGRFSSVKLVYGDSSPEPALSTAFLDRLRSRSRAISAIDYRFFAANLGSARGHNHLLADVSEDLVLIMNPDIMVAPDALIELARPLANARTGLVEARQVPVEHPKDYDPHSGQTSWATTACALVPAAHLRELKGFDAESFFLYCDDVDFSWRLRLAGYEIIFQPSAAAFHDKRLTHQGRWNASAAERYYSAEAALMLAHKYSREDIVERLLKDFSSTGIDHLLRAVAEYEARRSGGRLPEPIDRAHRVGEFKDGRYATHRFPL